MSREINFSSQEEMQQFRLEQRVFFKGTIIEGKIDAHWDDSLRLIRNFFIFIRILVT